MKTGKVSKNPKNNNIGKCNFFTCFFFLFRILVTLPIFMFFMIFQLILPVLLTPNNYCFHNQVIPPPDRLGVVYQTFTKLDMVYSDFIQENMITTKHGFSVKSGFTKIWSKPNLPLPYSGKHLYCIYSKIFAEKESHFYSFVQTQHVCVLVLPLSSGRPPASANQQDCQSAS